MDRRQIRNLTAMVYSAPAAPSRYESDGFVAELLRPELGVPFEFGPTDRDLVYVIVAGFGGVDGTDLTAGDVLHVPAGATANFTGLSRRFCTWRLSMAHRKCNSFLEA